MFLEGTYFPLAGKPQGTSLFWASPYFHSVWFQTFAGAVHFRKKDTYAPSLVGCKRTKPDPVKPGSMSWALVACAPCQSR